LRQESPARAFFLQDDRGNAEALQARTERDAALPAADDDDFGLARDAEIGFSLAGSFRMRVQRAERGEERVGAAFSQAQVADRAAGGGLEREPGFVFVRGVVREAPVCWFVRASVASSARRISSRPSCVRMSQVNATRSRQ
jgi:hypothetical protein